jgi:ankyrin repeat protein
MADDSDDDSELSYDPEDIDIHYMVKNDKYEVVEWAILLDYVRHLNTKDEYGRLPMYYACILGREDVVRLCIRKGALINARDSDERTALHGAVEAKNIEICKLLLNHGAYVNGKDLHCRSALHDACAANLYDIADLLIEKGADLSVEEMDNGKTALHICAEKGYTELAEMLILKGSNIMVSGDQVSIHGALNESTAPNAVMHQFYGKTPLHLACMHGHTETARMLISRGADVSVLSGFVSHVAAVI